MIEINLIPDVKKELLKANKTRNIVVTSSIFAGIGAIGLVVVLGIIIGGQMVVANTQKGTIESQSDTLSKVEDLSKMLTIQNQLGAIPGLNDGKPITSRVLGLLDVINSSGAGSIEVNLVSLDTEAKTLLIEGQTTGGYSMIETVVKTLNNAEISFDVRQDALSVDQSSDQNDSKKDDTNTEEVEQAEDINLLSEVAYAGEVSYGKDPDGKEVAQFTLSLVLTPEFLDIKNENLRVRIKNGGNATDSYLGVPQSIFAPKISNPNSQGAN